MRASQCCICLLSLNFFVQLSKQLKKLNKGQITNLVLNCNMPVFSVRFLSMATTCPNFRKWLTSWSFLNEIGIPIYNEHKIFKKYQTE